MQVLKSSRRSFMKWVAAAPLLSQIAAADLYAKAAERSRQRSSAKCLHSPGGKDRHQLPRHVDLSEWVSGVS